MILALVGLGVGLILGSLCPLTIPVTYSKLFSVALLAGLDSVFGGFRSALDDRFDNTVFMSGFFCQRPFGGFSRLRRGSSRHRPLLCCSSCVWVANLSESCHHQKVLFEETQVKARIKSRLA